MLHLALATNQVGYPVNLQLAMWAADAGRGVFCLLPRGLPPLLVGALTFGLALPRGILPYVAGIISVLLAMSVSFAGRFAVNLLAFWLVDIRGFVTTYTLVGNAFCGIVVPLSWYPEALRTAAAFTPFPGMLQTPVGILCGRMTAPQMAAGIGIQLAWLVAMLAAGQVVLRRATKKLVIQGG